jgi:hypothetical protein
MTYAFSFASKTLSPSLTKKAEPPPTGERLRKLDNRCITKTIHKLKGQSALAPARC